MNRKEYIDRLEQLLLVLPIEEREEALQYYEDYFEDAGIPANGLVGLELGTPEEVADNPNSFTGSFIKKMLTVQK